MTKTIIKTAMILSLLITAKLIESVIPNLPNGLGDISSLLEITIVISSIAVGFKESFFAIFIYIVAIAWISPHMFMGGVVWAKDAATFAGVYFLDYFIPLVILSFVGLFKFKKKLHIFLLASLLIFVNYISHSFAGVIFWKSYAWKGWSIYPYSFTMNLIKFGVIILASNSIIPLALILKPKLNKKNSWAD